MTKTIYIHGLDGSLSEEKKAILEIHTTVIAPIIDYRSNPNSYYDLLSIAIIEKVDYIIGTSMGGCMAYHLSLHLNKPSLLFNPALPFRSVDIELPEQNKERSNYLRVVIGGHDAIINPLENIQWIASREHKEMDIIWRNTLEHRIPEDIFRKEINDFFE